MKTIMLLLTTAVLATATSPARATSCADGERVFADVPTEHPFCQEIESLYRDGLTSGCRVLIKISCPEDTSAGDYECVEEEVRYFCPNDPLTRAAGAAFAGRRDLFAQIGPLGDVQFGDHVVGAERFRRGVYLVQFKRNIEGCSREGWAPSIGSNDVRVRVGRLHRSDDTVSVETDIAGQPADVWFNVRLHCR